METLQSSRKVLIAHGNDMRRLQGRRGLPTSVKLFADALTSWLTGYAHLTRLPKHSLQEYLDEYCFLHYKGDDRAGELFDPLLTAACRYRPPGKRSTARRKS